MSKTSTQQQQQQQQGSTEIKKKSHGGRHRIFTAEQRKDRNRLAQAAFRERRNQYTRTLENTVVELEAIIRELQESNRHTATRADQAEEKCQALEAENRSLKEKIASLVAASLSSSSKSQHTSIHASHPAVQSPANMSEASAPSCTLSELSTDQQPDFPIITETTTIGMPLLFLDNHLAIYQALFPKLSTATTGPPFHQDDDRRVPQSYISTYLG